MARLQKAKQEDSSHNDKEDEEDGPVKGEDNCYMALEVHKTYREDSMKMTVGQRCGTIVFRLLDTRYMSCFPTIIDVFE